MFESSLEDRLPSVANDLHGAKHIIDYRMLSDQVTTHLTKGLIFGRLQPGQRINEAELARNLGISRNPIREAVRRLEKRGLLVAVPRKGTFVRTFERRDIDEMFSFRIVVESFAVEQALPHMTDADLQRIADFVNAMIAAAGKNDEVGVVENDLALHIEICKLSNNRQTLHAFANIQTEVQMLITLAERRCENLMAAARDHIPLIEALKTRDPAVATAAMRHHIEVSWHDLLKEFGK